jgi:hypothetical protein
VFVSPFLGRSVQCYGGGGDKRRADQLIGRASDLACFMTSTASNGTAAPTPARLMITEG